MCRDTGLRTFLCLEAALYLAFLICDLFFPGWAATAFKYLSILLCAVCSQFHRAGRHGRLIAAAMALTALADLFLLVLDAHYWAGLVCFCAVQVLYALRLHWGHGGKTPLLWLRILLSGGALLLLWALHILTPITAMTGLYFPQLLCNGLEGLPLCHTGRSWRLFTAGLFLFLCCDICVGLHNVPLPSAALAAFAQFAMWLFYLPSQVLIVCSAWKGDACHAS